MNYDEQGSFHLRVCVCVCEREREREREGADVCVCFLAEVDFAFFTMHAPVVLLLQ
jgi:hypothetical protein